MKAGPSGEMLSKSYVPSGMKRISKLCTYYCYGQVTDMEGFTVLANGDVLLILRYIGPKRCLLFPFTEFKMWLKATCT